VVTFAADANNKYVVNTGVAAPGTIVLGAPGALVTIATGERHDHRRQLHAEHGVQQVGGAAHHPRAADADRPGWRAMDMADDVIQITDPVSGITFDVAVYRQFMQLVYHVRLAWGAQAIKPNHIAT
jgi:hypothetical protein